MMVTTPFVKVGMVVLVVGYTFPVHWMANPKVSPGFITTLRGTGTVCTTGLVEVAVTPVMDEEPRTTHPFVALMVGCPLIFVGLYQIVTVPVTVEKEPRRY